MNHQPLADRIRPTSFDEMVGQEHLFGEQGALRRMCQRSYFTNMIFYGPPGTGKTTAANIIAEMSGMPLYKLNATSAGLSDVKAIIDQTSTMMGAGGVLLYLDEIQYFNKKQQQSLLECLEDGRITLIASTTENPHLYVYNAILSRSAVFEFRSVLPEQILPALKRALRLLNEDVGGDVTADDEALAYIASCSGGDVRGAVGLLEHTYYTAADRITKEDVDRLTPRTIGNFDKSGNVHYDLLSGLQKSIRGSDPDATIFYLARILEGGDLIGACRRLQVIASEDIGLAYPQAPAIVRACVDSAMAVGLPEATIPLSNAAVMLATVPKSNSAHIAYEKAAADIRAGKGRTIPPYMSPVHEYQGYRYPHDYPNHWVDQNYLPEDLKGTVYYEYGPNKTEQAAKAYWDAIKKKG